MAYELIVLNGGPFDGTVYYYEADRHRIFVPTLRTPASPLSLEAKIKYLCYERTARIDSEGRVIFELMG